MPERYRYPKCYSTEGCGHDEACVALCPTVKREPEHYHRPGWVCGVCGQLTPRTPSIEDAKRELQASRDALALWQLEVLSAFGFEPEPCPGCDCDPIGYAPHNGKGTLCHKPKGGES